MAHSGLCSLFIIRQHLLVAVHQVKAEDILAIHEIHLRATGVWYVQLRVLPSEFPFQAYGPRARCRMGSLARADEGAIASEALPIVR